MSSLFEIENVNFRFYTDEEFKRTAAVQITEEMTFDSLNTPVRGGLYDPRMGPLDNFSNCETCSLSEKMCPGHMGYIQLEYPAYHPRMRPELRKVLLGSCIYCQRLKIKPQRRFFYMKRFELVRAGLFTVSRQLEECPDAFFGDLQEHHLANLFRSRTGPQSRKKDGEDENEEEEEGAEKTSFISHHESRNPYLLTDTELEAIDNVVNKLIIAEAKKNGYSEAKLDAFFESVVSDVHAPVHHERLLIAREFFAEISGRCPFCASLHSSWTSPDKSGNKLYCNVPKSSKPPRLDDTSHLALQRIIRAVYGQVETAERESLYAPDLSRPIYMFPQEVFNFVAAVWKNDSDVFDYIYNSPGSDKLTHNHLFMNIVPVPPNRYRSPMKRSGAFFEHDLNYLFRQVVFLTKSIKRDKQALVGDLISDTIFSRVNDAQRIVNDLFDFDDNAQALHKRVIFGYKQVIEKKEGLMRTNMMGKRVNFSARSVILPDPMIHTDEVSVPLVFAKKLSFPEVVNDLNLARLRQSILNGPDVYPGANALKVDGKIFHFKTLPYFRRKAMSQVLQKGNTVVMRHIKDGDMFLVNRQPSLHRVSMMAHKARVLSNNYQKTIRIHYANCKSYNADFDGDEMNLHIPQDLVSQSEARELVKNSNQYCSPTSGEPIRGLIQDHIVSGVLLTLKDTFFDRETYQSLVFGSIFHRVGDHRIETVPPCIIKPRPLWSGKQVVTTILKDIAAKRAGINLDCGAKLKNCWGDHKEEETVIIRDNEVMTGIFDKNQIGSSEFGIVHAFDEVYGHDASAELLTCFTRLTTLFLQYHGFTCGVDDLMVTDDCNENRSKIMKAADSDARHATAEFAKQKRLADSKLYDQNSIIKNMSSLLVNDRNRRKLDAEVKKALSKHTSKLISESIPRGLMKPFPANNMTLMTQSGAKGSLVNASQISCCLGLQEFEGRRVRPTVSGKTLPSFEVYDTSAISGGYVASRFLTGIKPQEYFFHCMAGRDGLIDTAVKTARSGYLQRCLVKALEDLTVKYDGTVRNESNTVVQFKYGGDSIDPLKSSFLHNSKFAAMNHKAVAEKYRLSEDEEHTDKSVLKYKGSDPVASVYDPWRVKGAVSDKFARNLSEYIESNPDGLVLASKKRKDALLSDIHVSLDKFKSISNERFMRSLVNPGEAVGVIAAQSIGEPSTQMTLNTFHFAGLDVAHVTVGIPRLIELFMIGQTKTVLTTLPVKSVHKNEMLVKKFAASMSSVTFGDALEYVDIIEKIGYNPNTNERERSISLNIKFDLEEFSKYYGISVDQFWETVKAILIRNIVLTIKQYLMHGRFKSRIALAGVTKQRVIDVNQKTKQATFLSNSDFKDAGENAEASVMGDNQSTSTKSTKKQTKKKADEESDGEDEMESDSEDEQSDDEEEESEDEGEEQAEEQDAKKKKKSTPKESKDDLAIEQSPFYKSFDIQRKEGILTIELNDGVKDHRIFLKDVVHKVCQSTYLRTYTGIEKVNVIQQRQGQFELQMEGFNIEELLMTRQAAEFIDFNSIITNDIRATAATYGIEAAYQLLVNEMKNVFKLYGIPVDERHICLIAEHMTNTGEYRACNRASMVSSPGVFHKATFESSLTFLGNSTAYAEIDQVRGPSAELILGKTVSQGTGSFDILIPEVKCN